jgi:hypothetical protein
MAMDDRSKQSLSLILRHHTADAFILSAPEAAPIVVIDLDRDSAQAEYASLRVLHPEVRAIELASQPVAASGDILVLRKPVSASRLIEAIRVLLGLEPIKSAGVAASLSARLTRDKSRKKSAVSLVREQLQFDPDEHLLGTTRRQSDTLVEAPSVSQHRERGLLSSILERLIGKGATVSELEEMAS